MTNQDVKKIVKEVVDPQFDQIRGEMQEMKTGLQSEMTDMKRSLGETIKSTISRHVGIFEEHFLDRFQLSLEYTDGKDNSMNIRMNKLEKNQKRNFNLICDHDRQLEALKK